MNKTIMSPKVKEALKTFLNEHKKVDLVTVYLFYLEQAHHVHPVIFIPDRTIFCNRDQAVEILEKENKLWRETEIKITFEKAGVNNDTKKIYICPFSGKVFGDNTHPNPQDAIYDWVATCPENNEFVGGLKSKRFHVSEDPEVIKNYISPPAKTLTKCVFSSAVNGKLFNSKQAAIADCLQHYFKPIALADVQNQNRYQMHQTLLEFLQKELDEQRISRFVDSLAEDISFKNHISHWVSEEAAENE
jgi:hypothetical protein